MQQSLMYGSLPAPVSGFLKRIEYGMPFVPRFVPSVAGATATGASWVMHIGLIGGIGPAATEFYYRHITAAHARAEAARST